MIQIKRAYDPPSPQDGTRILIDRLWPRGLKKEDLQLSTWSKDLAPSTPLRQWFGHDPKKWPEFRARYFAELKSHPAALQPLLAVAKRGTTTLLYAAHDPEHNNALALKEYLDRKLKPHPTPKPRRNPRS